jgi:hypothetical protein
MHVRQAAVIEVDGGLVLEYVAPRAVASDKSTWMRVLGSAWRGLWGCEVSNSRKIIAVPLTMVMPSTPAEACASFLTSLTAAEAVAEGAGRRTDRASHITYL